MINDLVPYLAFDGQAAAAMAFYTSALGAQEEGVVMRWADLPGQDLAPELADRVMHACLRVGGRLLCLADVPPGAALQRGTDVDILLDLSDPGEVDRCLAALAEGGRVTMPVEDTFWNARYGEVTDRFGVRWKLNAERGAACTATPDEVDPARDLVLERVVDVPPARVWEAWTTPELLMAWFCPRPWRVTACELDLRPGGRFRTVMEGPEGERHDSTGCILEVIPGRRLVFTDALGPGFRPTGEPFQTAEISLTPQDGGTRYRAVARHASPETREAHRQMGFEEGWGRALNQLVELVKRR